MDNEARPTTAKLAEVLNSPVLKMEVRMPPITRTSTKAKPVAIIRSGLGGHLFRVGVLPFGPLVTIPHLKQFR
jgi:hypothetical protein